MIAAGALDATPKTRGILAKKHDDLVSDDPHKWRPAAIAVYDALEDDVLVALHGVRQSLSCTPVIADSLNSFTPRVLYPKVSSLDSIDLAVKKPEAEHPLLAEIIQSVVAEAKDLEDACTRYNAKLGYLPLAPPYGLAKVISEWLATHPETDAWKEVWEWARAAFGPVPLYHACSVFVVRPDLVPTGKLPDLWREIMTVIGPSGIDTEEKIENEPWLLHRDLARHFAFHIEAQLPDTEGANIACLAWWLSEQVTAIFPDLPQSAKFYRENWVKPALERSTHVWFAANPHIGRSFLRYMTATVHSPWAASLLALMGAKLDQLAPAEQSAETQVSFYKSLFSHLVMTLPFWMNLPRARRKRHRRCPRTEGRGHGRIPNQRRIDTRPAEVELRRTVGHWEGDLINGAHETGNLITLVERNTRFTLVGRTGSKEAAEVMRGICAQFETLPQSARLSLTLDNGKEFARHEEMARTSNMDVFFARPYHSWERGTNENTNGLIRRLHPKKSSFADIGRAELKRIDTYLNDRPRKCLGWMTPREKMTVFLACAS